MGCLCEAAECYVGSWLGGFEWAIFVGVDAFAYGKAGSSSWGKVRGCVYGAVCHFVVEQVFSGAFEEAMRWCACVVMDADTVCWFMLGCVAFCVYCHAGSAHKYKIRLKGVLDTAADLAAAALCIE